MQPQVVSERITMDDVAEQSKEVAQSFSCLICLQIVDYNKAVQCDQCETIFDKDCLAQCLKVRNRCPNCRKSTNQKPLNRHMKSFLADLHIMCSNCQSNDIRYENLHAHIKKCKNAN